MTLLKYEDLISQLKKYHIESKKVYKTLKII